MSPLFTWILAASSVLAPGRSHERIAEAIAARVEAEAPLFKDDEDRRRTAALMVAIAFRESSLRLEATGDKRKGKATSFCAYQVHLPWDHKTPDGWSGSDLLEDPDKCVGTAMKMLRVSFRACAAHPLAQYAEGPTGCASPRAQRISRDRLAIAQHLVRTVPWPPKADVEEKSEGATESAPAKQGEPRSPAPSPAEAKGASAAPVLRLRRFCAP